MTEDQIHGLSRHELKSAVSAAGRLLFHVMVDHRRQGLELIRSVRGAPHELAEALVLPDSNHRSGVVKAKLTELATVIYEAEGRPKLPAHSTLSQCRDWKLLEGQHLLYHVLCAGGLSGLAEDELGGLRSGIWRRDGGPSPARTLRHLAHAVRETRLREALGQRTYPEITDLYEVLKPVWGQGDRESRGRRLAKLLLGVS